jgi:hypothetical protein
MNKIDKFKDYMKANGEEIAIGIAVGAFNIGCGIIMHKMYVSKKYGELIKLTNKFKVNKEGETCYQGLCEFLRNAHSVYPVIPGFDAELRDAVSEELVEHIGKYGYNPDDKISGMLVGFKNN